MDRVRLPPQSYPSLWCKSDLQLLICTIIFDILVLMIRRDIEDELLESARKYPVVTILGPRQAGKTTLARSVFPDRAYYSLDRICGSSPNPIPGDFWQEPGRRVSFWTKSSVSRSSSPICRALSTGIRGEGGSS